MANSKTSTLFLIQFQRSREFPNLFGDQHRKRLTVLHLSADYSFISFRIIELIHVTLKIETVK